MENLMRAPPDIEVTWVELFWKACGINEGAKEDQSTLSIVVGEAGLFIELLKREYTRCMDYWGKCREACKDEDREPEQAVMTALIGWMDNNVHRKNAESNNLVGK